MKSRRVLQIIVAVLSIALLACLAALAAALYLADLIPSMPQGILDFGNTFKTGMKEVSDKFFLYDQAVPVLLFSVPGALLLVATILLLVKKGKEAKNVVGCIFALLGALTLTAFLMVFAKELFAEGLLLAAFCASGGLLALFILFVGLALGVRTKQVAATEVAETEQTDEQTEQATADEQEASETADEEAEQEEAYDEELEDEEQEIATEDELKKLEEELAALEKQLAELEINTEAKPIEEEPEQETPATQYVPHLGVTIHDVVAKTYGKEGDELTPTTLAKIKKVRELYDAKAISEQEYIKLINKYLGF